jgi:hypothetical protein
MQPTFFWEVLITQLVNERFYPLGGYISPEVLYTQDLVLPEDLPLNSKQSIAFCNQYGFAHANVTLSQEQ